jgi:hypothetical protein
LEQKHRDVFEAEYRVRADRHTCFCDPAGWSQALLAKRLLAADIGKATLESEADLCKRFPVRPGGLRVQPTAQLVRFRTISAVLCSGMG